MYNSYISEYLKESIVTTLKVGDTVKFVNSPRSVTGTIQNFDDRVCVKFKGCLNDFNLYLKYNWIQHSHNNICETIIECCS